MNYSNPMMMRQGFPPMGYGPDRGMEGGAMQRPFLHRPMQTGGGDPAYPMPGMPMGGNLPPQQGGYDSSGINPGGGPLPGGMHTGGALPPMQQGGMQTGGNYPPMRLAQMGGQRMGQGFPGRLGLMR